MTVSPQYPVDVGRVRKHYDRLAHLYRLFWGEHLHHGYFENNESPAHAQIRLMERLAERAAIPAGARVLDIGCGPGHYSITLAQRGAARVVGIDFAEGMLKLATEHARQVGVADRCHFQVADFYQYPPEEQFDYVIVMGFMDYMPDPEKVIAKVLSLTRNKAFFSFPVAGGILGWQRKLRYQKRCDLFLYTAEQLQRIFAKFPEATAKVESISRDYFVTLTRNGKKV